MFVTSWTEQAPSSQEQRWTSPSVQSKDLLSCPQRGRMGDGHGLPHLLGVKAHNGKSCECCWSSINHRTVTPCPMTGLIPRGKHSFIHGGKWCVPRKTKWDIGKGHDLGVPCGSNCTLQYLDSIIFYCYQTKQNKTSPGMFLWR